MEENHHIGTIDTLMIMRAIQERGYRNLEQRIKNHIFKKTIHDMDIKYYPFRIVHRCTEDGSELSNWVFGMIRNTEHQLFLSKNTGNYNHRFHHNGRVIDHCTTWKPILANAYAIDVTATFYDKEVLLTTCKKMQPKL